MPTLYSFTKEGTRVNAVSGIALLGDFDILGNEHLWVLNNSGRHILQYYDSDKATFVKGYIQSGQYRGIAFNDAEDCAADRFYCWKLVGTFWRIIERTIDGALTKTLTAVGINTSSVGTPYAVEYDGYYIWALFNDGLVTPADPVDTGGDDGGRGR
jgi:hypothetical protein